ncbi:MAG: UDP-N-acetylmuramate--L-alanine ligase [Gemmatimonadales bacterium]
MYLFDPDDSRPIHFMGIGGAGMGALALITQHRGVVVTGCDVDPGAVRDVDLAGAGLLEGHDPRHVKGARAVIHTSAVQPDHPELIAARESGLPVLRRAEALQAVVEGGTVVAVSGTHGKTTTTVMITDLFAAAGRDPTGIVGGRVAKWRGNARSGGSALYVVEADEYDRSFLALSPTVAVVNNVEADHLECYGSLELMEDAFVEFADRADRAIVGADDPGAKKIASRLSAPVWSVGFDEGADFRVSEVIRVAEKSSATLHSPDGGEYRLELSVPGLHNIRNAATSIAAVAALDVDIGSACSAVTAFTGVTRRFEILGTRAGVTVVDDYAHHPTEVAAAIDAARQRFPNSRLITVFQPHLYSRTQAMGAELGNALTDADVVVVTDIYGAREKPIAGVSGRMVSDVVVQAGTECHWVPQANKLARFLSDFVDGGDTVLTLGAGDITRIGRELLVGLSGTAA